MFSGDKDRIIDVMSTPESDDIQKLLFKKMKELGIQKNDPDWIKNELNLIRTNCHNSYLYNIIKDYYNFDTLENYHNISMKGNIIHLAIKFLKLKYNILSKPQKPQKENIPIEYIDMVYGSEILKVPSKIGHGYTPIKMISLKELHTKYSTHKRLRVFHHKGLDCVSCSRIGKYLISAKDIADGVHVDLYTKDFELMTIDHIKPKSKGGSDNIENLNPMCEKCNTTKSDNYEDLEW